MRNIKYQFKIFLIIASISLVSCNKYLDQQPITSVGANVVFADETGAYQALVGVYSRLTGDQGYGKCLSLYYTVDNDETQGPGSANDDARRGMSRYTLSSSNGELEAPFNQIFRGIDYANTCIDNIPKMNLYNNGTDQQKKRLKRMLGEAYTLRAQFYFDAIKIWGDLPAHFQPSYAIAAANPFPSKVNRDTLYAQILTDLASASTMVPWKSELASIGDPMDERITKASVKALRARIALFAGGYSLRPTNGALGQMERRSDYLTFYQIAKKECADIMANGQNNLNPSFKSLWKDQVAKLVANDPDGELIFQITGIGGTSVEDTKLGYYNGPQVGSFGNKSINILPTYFYLFDSTDTRRDVTCVPYNVNADGVTKVGTSITAINDGKYRRDWSTNPQTQNQWNGMKWQLIRYSDVLLMFAEAENEINGPTQAAYDAINMVRRRGFGKPINTIDATVDLPSGLSKDDFFKALTKERSLEFGGEGLRKYDLVRWNLLAKRINETKVELQKMNDRAVPYNTLPTSMFFITGSTADDATVWQNSFYKTAPSSTPAGTAKLGWMGSSTIAGSALARYAIGFTTGKSELFPLPIAAINANANLKQNPGYQ